MSADQPPASHRGLRRLGGGIVAVAIGLGAVVLLLLFLSSRDTGHVAQDSDAAAQAPGQPYGTPERQLDAAQLRLLALGDVFLVYGTARAPAALRALQERLSGPPDPALEQAGQAVVLVRRAGTDGVVALGGDHALRTGDAADPALDTFASYWLGGPAGG